MESTRIVAEVTPEGQIRLDAQGFQGSGCLTATDQLKSRLAILGLCLEDGARQDKLEMALETDQLAERQRTRQ
jgi:hypothetical protein